MTARGPGLGGAILLVLGALLVSAALGAFAANLFEGQVHAHTPASGEAVEAREVTMGPASFAPAVVRVRAGESVTWRNTDGLAHAVEGDGFASGMLAAGEAWSATFSPGRHEYHCPYHEGMVGAVVVA